MIEKKNDIDLAFNLFNSIRGRYIMSQALYVAIKTMKRAPKQKREYSNIQDMEFILDNIFGEFKAAHLMTDKHKKERR